jgi:hypothetical protein
MLVTVSVLTPLSKRYWVTVLRNRCSLAVLTKMPMPLSTMLKQVETAL